MTQTRSLIIMGKSTQRPLRELNEEYGTYLGFRTQELPDRPIVFPALKGESKQERRAREKREQDELL